VIGIKKISDAWIADIVANLKTSLGLLTVEAHEPTYDDKTLAELMILAPAVLVRYEGLAPIESERLADGASGLNKEQFSLVFIAQSLLNPQEGPVGCYTMLDAFRARYNGYALAIPGEGQVDLALGPHGFLQSDGGVVAYYQMYSYDAE
jgi:hypothetical protein